MSRPIIDAGPALNFFSLNRERLLFQVAGALSTPETVREEILRKASQDPRFQAAERVVKKLPEKYLEILSDGDSPDLRHTVERLTDHSFNELTPRTKNAGETMAIAHAALLAERGQDAFLLMDDFPARQIVAQENRRLARLHTQGRKRTSCPRIIVIGTADILTRAVREHVIGSRAELKKLYLRMRELDDGLLPFDQSDLPQLFRRPPG